MGLDINSETDEPSIFPSYPSPPVPTRTAKRPMLRNNLRLMTAHRYSASQRVLVESSAGDLLKAAHHSLSTHWLVRALEWTSLLPALGVCAWVILNYG
jgi:hypothetical protein